MLLEKINSPDDLRKIDQAEYPALAAEIRKVIIDTVSQTGGHLASSLGVVELTLALHSVFDTPRDWLVWDVGHQAYAHKLITGRREQFKTLRQWKGLSGFPKRSESLYDTFNTGHASTSISAALGMTEGLRLKGKRAFTIPVIGDGSMTAGMAFEALNHAGTLKRGLIVILNDNAMSISPNVGAMKHYLNRIKSGQFYHKFKKEVEHILKSVPTQLGGGGMLKAAERLKDALKSLVNPVTLFEELGFEYYGPIDGHDIGELIETFDAVKKLEGPILIHVVTRKGKGYAPAEENPHLFHSAAPFDIKTGKFIKKVGVPSYTDFFSDFLVQQARHDDKIIAITAAMTEGTGLIDFASEFPERFYDVGIAEQHAVTFAAGLAVKGFKPVVAIYSTFLQRAFDQIAHDVCLQNLHVTFAIDRAGIVGADGPTHNGIYDFSYLRILPNITLMAPRDENELGRMMATAGECNGPVGLRYPRGRAVGLKLDHEFSPVPIGKGELLKEGSDVALLALGVTVYPALEAASRLEKDGIKAAVFDARFLKPLDRKQIMQLARKCGKLVTIEENVLPGGFGSAVQELLEQESFHKVQLRRIGIPDHIIDHGSQDIIRHQLGLDAEGIYTTTKDCLARTHKLHAVKAG